MISSQDYSAAVSYAEDCIRSYISVLPEIEDAARSALRNSLLEDTKRFLEDSKTYEGHSAVCLAISRVLEEGGEIPPLARTWLSEFLQGKIVAPKRGSGRPQQNMFIPILVLGAVSACVDAGMMATRNDASEPVSACDAVAEAMCKLGIRPASYEGVKRVWLEARKSSGDVALNRRDSTGLWFRK